MGIKLGLSIKQNSQNTATNKTNVTVEVLLTFDSGSWSGSGSQGYLTIDGTKYGFWGTFNTAQAISGTTTMFSKTVDIEHDSEGNKTLEVSAEYITASWGTKTASASQALTPIPRASAIAATDANIGAVSMIAVTRKGTGYTHSIAYKFGSLSGYITAAGGVSASEVKLSETSVPFTLPDSFYGQIPNAKTGTCTLTIKTYSGSTQIGDAATATFTVAAAESACKPTVSGTVVDSNSTTKALTGDASKLVRHKSTALCTISAAANKSATLSQKQIAGTVVTENTLEIEGVEESKVLFAATDSRGYTTTAEVAFELVPYVLLTNNPVGRRTDPTSGKATLTLKGNYYNGSFGSKSNTLTVRYRIGPQGGSYGSWVTVTPTKSGNTYSAEVSLTGLDYETTYVAEVEVTDSLDQVVKTAPIKKGMPVFDWGENDFAFHVPVVMNGHRITKLPTPAADTEPATKGYTDKENLVSLVDNGDFTDPVNQRGGASYAVSGYTIDRWKAASAALTVTPEEGAISLANSNASARVAFYQLIPDKRMEAGKYYTFVVCDTDGNTTAVSVAHSTTNYTGGSASITNGTINITKTSAGTRVNINVNAASTVSLVWAALYEGQFTADTRPSYKPKGYMAELLECMWYLQIYAADRQCIATTTTGFYADVFLAVPMRITPTATLLTTPSWLRYGGTHLALTEISISAVTKYSEKAPSILVQFATTPAPDSGNYAGYLGSLRLMLSAEL